MKRTTILFLLLALCLALVACGGKAKTPIEKAQAKIVEIGEQFLNYELTADEAKEKLDSILIPDTDDNNDTYLEAHKGALVFQIIKSKTGSAGYDDVKDKIDWIKGFDYTD